MPSPLVPQKEAEPAERAAPQSAGLLALAPQISLEQIQLIPYKSNDFFVPETKLPDTVTIVNHLKKLGAPVFNNPQYVGTAPTQQQIQNLGVLSPRTSPHAQLRQVPLANLLNTGNVGSAQDMNNSESAQDMNPLLFKNDGNTASSATLLGQLGSRPVLNKTAEGRQASGVDSPASRVVAPPNSTITNARDPTGMYSPNSTNTNARDPLGGALGYFPASPASGGPVLQPHALTWAAAHVSACGCSTTGVNGSGPKASTTCVNGNANSIASGGGSAGGAAKQNTTSVSTSNSSTLGTAGNSNVTMFTSGASSGASANGGALGAGRNLGGGSSGSPAPRQYYQTTPTDQIGGAPMIITTGMDRTGPVLIPR